MKKILIIIFLLLFNSTSYAETIYLNCEEIVQKVREATYESLYVEGKTIGNSFVKIKSKTIDMHYAYPGGETFELITNKKFKKTDLGFTVKDKYKDNKFKTEEFFEFIKPLDDYVFKRSSYFWTAETSTDGENVSDYDSSGRCETIEKKEYLKLIK
tara:strand:- start:63 stop:530 length:468 start_codon:yes stop_codon:yes gene_type:complete